MCENENGQCRKIRFFGYRKSEEAFSVVESKPSRIDKTVWVGLDRWAVMEELLSSGDQFTLKAELCLRNGCRNQIWRKPLLKISPMTIQSSFDRSL
jgi:hypothetical protein